MTIADVKFVSTISSIWICTIHGRFLATKHAAWKRKSDAVLAFKHSEYWGWIVDELKNNNPDKVAEGYRGDLYWKHSEEGQELENQAYKDLIDKGIVKFIEIKPIPEWANI